MFWKDVLRLAGASLALAAAALGSPPARMQGPLLLRVDIAPASQAAYDAGLLQRTASVNLVVSFRPLSFGDTGLLILRPVDASVTAEGGQQPSSTTDSTLTDAVVVPVGLDLEVGNDGRVSVPVVFTPRGRVGAALNAELRVTGAHRSLGKSALVFGYGTSGALVIRTVSEINYARRAALRADPGQAGTEGQVHQVVPLDESRFATELSQDSELVGLPGLEEGTPR